MHQMGLTQSHASVNKQRIITLGGRFGNRKRGCVCEFVVSAHNESAECVARVQIRCNARLAGEIIIVFFIFLRFRFLLIRGSDKTNFAMKTGLFLNRDLKIEVIFLINITDKVSTNLILRKLDENGVAINRRKTERCNPGIIRDIADFVFFFYVFCTISFFAFLFIVHGNEFRSSRCPCFPRLQGTLTDIPYFGSHGHRSGILSQ